MKQGLGKPLADVKRLVAELQNRHPQLIFFIGRFDLNSATTQNAMDAAFGDIDDLGRLLPDQELIGFNDLDIYYVDRSAGIKQMEGDVILFSRLSIDPMPK